MAQNCIRHGCSAESKQQNATSDFKRYLPMCAETCVFHLQKTCITRKEKSMTNINLASIEIIKLITELLSPSDHRNDCFFAMGDKVQSWPFFLSQRKNWIFFITWLSWKRTAVSSKYKVHCEAKRRIRRHQAKWKVDLGLAGQNSQGLTH